MITVRDRRTGVTLVTTNRYRGLRAVRDSRAGFASLLVQVEGDAARTDATTNWPGHDLIWSDAGGIKWEGRIESVAPNGMGYVVQGMGYGPALMSDMPYGGIILETRAAQMQAAGEATGNGLGNKSAGYLTKSFPDDNALEIGLKKSHNFANGELHGFYFKNPYTMETSAGTVIGPNIKYVEVDFTYPFADTAWEAAVYVRLATDGFWYRAVGYTMATGITDHVVVTNSNGYSAFAFVLRNKSGISITNTTDDNTVRVRISGIRFSSAIAGPGITAGRAVEYALNIGGGGFVVRRGGLDNITLTEPLRFEPGQAQGAVDEVMEFVQMRLGTPLVYGVGPNKVWSYSAAPRRYWSIPPTIGPSGFEERNRQVPQVSGSYTGVRARWQSADGDYHLTPATYVTGKYLAGIKRNLEVKSTATSGSDAASDAYGMSRLHGSTGFDAQASLTGVARVENGPELPVSEVAVGDFAIMQSAPIGSGQSAPSRGGLIGRTTYDGDKGEVTIELLGPLGMSRR